MKISIIGGTGGMGEGLALRWVPNHDIMIGSRERDKAIAIASEYEKKAKGYYKELKGSIRGGENIEIAKDCDVLILSIPYEHTRDICLKLSEVISKDTIVVTPIVPMRKVSEGFEYIPIHDKGTASAAEVVASILDRNSIVSTLHTISEVKLKDLGKPLDCDVYICSDNIDNANVVSKLLSEISGLRPLYLGQLRFSYQIEVLTPMLLNIAIRNKLKHPGLKIV